LFDAGQENADANQLPSGEIPDEGAVALAGKQSQESFTAADTIIEALDLADAELERINSYKVCSHNDSMLESSC
jgi:U3 small nucleolar RNA-associated protein 12